MEIAPKHTLFETVDAMLVPATLSELLSKQVAEVDVMLIDDHEGVAGGKLSRIKTDARDFILKQMDSSHDWAMYTTNDHRCRSVTLWQYGLLDDLRLHFEHKIVACSYDGDGWAILMEDLGEAVFRWPDRQPSAQHVRLLLDGFAWQHARYWNRSELQDEQLGLCSMAEYLNSLNFPEAHKQRETTTWGIIPGLLSEGWQVAETLLGKQVFAEVLDLSENPKPLLAAADRYPATFFHGDVNINNMGYADKLVLLDWQIATYSLMTAGLAWITRHGWMVEHFGDEDSAIAFYRERLETHLDERIDDMEWQAMVDLGYAVDALRCTGLWGYNSKHVEDEEGREWNRREVLKCGQRIIRAKRWF